MKTVSETSGTTLSTPVFTLQGVPEGDERKDLRRYLKIIADSFPNMGNETVIKIQDAQRGPGKMPKEEHSETYSNQTDKN